MPNPIDTTDAGHDDDDRVTDDQAAYLLSRTEAMLYRIDHPDEFAIPDEFGDIDEAVPKQLPRLDHVGPVQSGTLRPFVCVDKPDRGMAMFTDGRVVEVSRTVTNLAETYQADEPMIMAQIGALTRWLQAGAASFDEAVALGRAAGLDQDHAQRLARLAGFKQVTTVRFETENDADASRLAGVMDALGYAPIRVVATLEHRNRWALAELLRTRSLSPSEHDLAASMLGVTEDGARRKIVEERLAMKLCGKTLEQAVAEIAEVRP